MKQMMYLKQPTLIEILTMRRLWMMILRKLYLLETKMTNQKLIKKMMKTLKYSTLGIKDKNTTKKILTKSTK